jgi:hypothetical protein
MVDPTSLTLGLNMWQIYLGIAIFGFFNAAGSEFFKYIWERYVRHRLDKVDIKVKPGEVEITTRKQMKHAGTRDIYIDNEGEETTGEYRT